jgi:hypothetical protein
MRSLLVSHIGQESHSLHVGGTIKVKLLTNETTVIADITITTTLARAAEHSFYSALEQVYAL